MHKSTLLIVIFILSLLGFGVSGFLTYEYSLSGPVTCPILNTGCDIVRSSKYSVLLGVSVPILGIFYYLASSLTSLIILEKNITQVKMIGVLVYALGFLFSIYFTYLEAFVIKSYCFWCLTSAIISTLMFITYLIYLRSKNEN